jgi:hypothetical protein
MVGCVKDCRTPVVTRQCADGVQRGKTGVGQSSGEETAAVDYPGLRRAESMGKAP